LIGHANPGPQIPERVVLLGAGGFIGGALAADLGSRGVPLLPLSSQDIDLTCADAAPKLAALIRPGDSLVMLTAVTPDRGGDLQTLRRNLKMGHSLCAALDRSPCAHVIYFSSDAVYSFRTSLISEVSDPEPATLYGVMHRARELILRETIRCPLLILRPTQVFGLGDTHDSYGPTRMRHSAAAKSRIVLSGEGEETRDHILIHDLVELVYALLTHCSTGILNAATGESVSYRDLAQVIASQFEEEIETPRWARPSPQSTGRC
jgi:nucleoside-diphosphate-sugar epimerase